MSPISVGAGPERLNTTMHHIHTSLVSIDNEFCGSLQLQCGANVRAMSSGPQIHCSCAIGREPPLKQTSSPRCRKEPQLFERTYSPLVANRWLTRTSAPFSTDGTCDSFRSFNMRLCPTRIGFLRYFLCRRRDLPIANVPTPSRPWLI